MPSTQQSALPKINGQWVQGQTAYKLAGALCGSLADKLYENRDNDD
jgi:hypothetical protein